MRLLPSFGIAPSMTGEMTPIARMQRRSPAYSLRLFALSAKGRFSCFSGMAFRQKYIVAMLPNARTMMAKSVNELSAVAKKAKDAAERTEPARMHSFLWRSPMRENTVSQQTKQHVVPTPTHPPLKKSSGKFSLPRKPSRQIKPQATNPTAPARGGCFALFFEAAITKTRKAAVLLSAKGRLHALSAWAPMTNSGRYENPQSENEFMARKQANPIEAATMGIRALIFKRFSLSAYL